MDWFRSWHGAPTDTKWLLIARKARVQPGIVSAIAWALLDHASQNSDRGTVSDFDIETYAVFSGFEEDTIASVMAAMIEKGVIVDGKLAAWDRRQPKGEDLTGAERQRRWRERQKSKNRDVTDNNVTVTDNDRYPPLRGVTVTRNEADKNRTEQSRGDSFPTRARDGSESGGVGPGCEDDDHPFGVRGAA